MSQAGTIPKETRSASFTDGNDVASSTAKRVGTKRKHAAPLKNRMDIKRVFTAPPKRKQETAR